MSAFRRPFLSILAFDRSCLNLLKVPREKTPGENDDDVKTESDDSEDKDRKEKKDEGEKEETGEMKAVERREQLSKFPYFRIEMSILNGRELIAMDRGGTSDPYVKVVQASANRKFLDMACYGAENDQMCFLCFMSFCVFLKLDMKILIHSNKICHVRISAKIKGGGGASPDTREEKDGESCVERPVQPLH